MKFTLAELRVFLECLPLAKIGIQSKLEDILKDGKDIKILEVFIGDSAFDILVYLDDHVLALKLRTYANVDTFAYPIIGGPNLENLLDFLDSVANDLKRLLATKIFEETRRPK